MTQPLGLATKVDPSQAEALLSHERLARLTNANLLIMGADEAVAGFLAVLFPHDPAACVVRRRGEPLRLSTTGGAPAHTILVYDVDTLTRPDQDTLHRWMNAGNDRTRVVSTATQSLLPVLETGAFKDDLYYRLNVLTFDLRSPDAQ